jgi:hypothetical protein
MSVLLGFTISPLMHLPETLAEQILRSPCVAGVRNAVDQPAGTSADCARSWWQCTPGDVLVPQKAGTDSHCRGALTTRASDGSDERPHSSAPENIRR